MTYRIQFVDDLMVVVGDDGDGFDAFEVDPQRPWDAIEALAEWGREYDLEAVDALGALRRHFKACQ